MPINAVRCGNPRPQGTQFRFLPIDCFERHSPIVFDIRAPFAHVVIQSPGPGRGQNGRDVIETMANVTPDAAFHRTDGLPCKLFVSDRSDEIAELALNAFVLPPVNVLALVPSPIVVAPE